MKAGAVWVAGIAGLAVLGAAGLYRTLPNVENDVRSTVAKALADKGFGDVRADVSGQTVTLSVGDTVADPTTHLEQAKAVLANLDGKVAEVRLVTLTETSPPQIAAPNPSALSTPTEVIKGETATTIAAAGNDQPRVAGDAALDAATEVARTCEDRITSAIGARKLSYRFGTYDLTADSEPILDDVYKAVSDCPAGVKVVIAGYTDTVGDPTANRLISESRAQTAADGLVKRGLEASRLSVQGMGGTAPVADNTTPEGRAANRRIVFKASAG